MLSKKLEQLRSYATNAFERRFRPHEFVQTNTTPYQIIYQHGMMCVRSYRALNAEPSTAESVDQTLPRTPLILVPPLGVPAWVFDLLEERSLVRFFAELGWDVYLIDWGSPGSIDAHFDLNHYVTVWLPSAVSAVIKDRAVDSREAQTSKVSMLGYCMGGLMSLMYLAARNENSDALPWQSAVKNVVTIASPIDFHDTAGVVGKLINTSMMPLKFLEQRVPEVFSRLERALPDRYFHVPGKMVAHAFALTQPLSRLTSHLNLLWNLADRSYVIQHTALASWFDDMLDYPGGVVQNMIFDLVPANRLKHGGMRLGQYRVDLQNVQANLLAVIGQSDTMVSYGAASAIVDLVGSGNASILESVGGHAGVFAGHSAPASTWQPIHEWLLSRA